jgi:putative tricarboxylic transport membrane protein
MVGLFAMVLRIPMWILMSAVTLLCIVGTYGLGNDLYDVWVMLGSGVFGFLMMRFDYNPAPLVLGMVFGPIVERSLIQSLLLFQGDILGFWKRPISGGILTFAGICFLAVGLIKWYSYGKKKQRPDDGR